MIYIKEFKENNINKSLADQFKLIADCYRFLGNENRFRVNAYDNVSKLLYNMTDDIRLHASNIKELDKLKGIGESIAEKIIEYVQTGKIKLVENLKKKVPIQLLPLMHIKNIGPNTIKLIYENVKIKDKKDLIQSIKNNELNNINGLGKKRIENVFNALNTEKKDYRFPLKEAEIISNGLIQEIEKINGVEKVTVAGSIRRRSKTIGDIDIVIQTNLENKNKLIQEIIKLPIIKNVKVKGMKKISFILYEKEIQVDCRIVDKTEYGAALLYFTGCKEHNIKLRQIAKNKGYKINEYGLFDLSNNKKIAGQNEKDIYKLLNLNYLPPEKRNNNNNTI